MAVMELWRRRDLEGAVKTEYIDGNFFTQDSVGNLVGVKVYKDGAEATLTGSVTGYCVLPSGETVSVAGTRSGNQASILVPQSALAYTGPLGITLKLVDGNTITTLMSIIVVVYRSKTDTVITPSSQIITDWANQIAAALQEVEDASAAQDEKIDDLKSAIEYAEDLPWVKELYVTPAGKTAGVTVLHQVRIQESGSPSYYLRFSNGTSFTAHTLSTTTPDYGFITIYSGQSGVGDVLGYILVDWSRVSANATPVKSLTEKAYRIEESPAIYYYLTGTVTNKKIEYDGYDYIDTTWAQVTVDLNLDDATDASNRFVTCGRFVSKGKLMVIVDSSLVNNGYQLRVMSKQSGALGQWGTALAITQTTMIVEYDDTVRVSIYQPNGINARTYVLIAKTTQLFTLRSANYLDYMRNKVINTKKIWCFGDSLTAGVITGTTTITESYPYWLKKFLDNDDLAISNFGVPGDTAINMLAVVQSKTFYQNCDIAILMIGTNGYMSGDADDPTTALGAYHATIKHIINNGKGTVKIILMNPPKSVRPSVPTRWLDSMHYKIELIANQYGLDCIDLYQFLPFEPDNATYYSSDKTHFTAIGYHWIAYIVYQYLTTHMTAQQIGGNPTFDY